MLAVRYKRLEFGEGIAIWGNPYIALQRTGDCPQIACRRERGQGFIGYSDDED